MGKTVLITGAAGGIGQGLVEALSNQGWSVIGSDHPSTTPNSILSRLSHRWIPADLTHLAQNQEHLDAFKAAVVKLIPERDLVGIVHNAALQRIGSFEKLTLTDWRDTIAVNVIAPAVINKALLPELRRNNGSVVHIGSIHSQLTKPGFTAYATSKAAMAGLTRAMAVELGGSVRVNAIEPAAIATPMLEAGFVDSPELKAQLERFHPTGSIGSPSDVANTVVFLLDSRNCFLNGCVLPLGGGIHSRLHDPV